MEPSAAAFLLWIRILGHEWRDSHRNGAIEGNLPMLSLDFRLATIHFLCVCGA
jgi:hypothetical protein